MSLGECPFVPRPGARPPVLAGRASLLESVAQERLALSTSTPSHPIVITGRVGSGRTAVGDELARAGSRAGWSPAVISITRSTVVIHEVARGVAAMLLRRLAVAADDRHAAPLLATTRAFAGAYDLDLPLDVEAASSKSWTGDPVDDVTYLFRLLGDAGNASGCGYLLIVDDIDLATSAGGSETMSAATDVTRSALPMLTVFTGLPGTSALLGSNVAEMELGPLGPADVAAALVEPARKLGVDIPVESIASIGRRTSGHPQFVQSLAAAAWEAAKQPTITPTDVEAGSFAAERSMMEHFFGPILEGLSPSERRFLRAMADVGPRPTLEMMSRRLGDANRFDRRASELIEVRDALLDRRVIFELAGGALEYSLPFFERYVGATR